MNSEQSESPNRTSASGYVYILVNPAMSGVVKIGFTIASPEERALEISRGRGIPAPWFVAYEEYVGDCRDVEHRLHERFAKHRHNPNRECFWIPLKEAISALREEASKSWAIEILPDLRLLLKSELRSDLSSVRLIHIDRVCWAEIVHESPIGLELHRINLTGKTSFEGLPFTIDRDIRENARKLKSQIRTRPKSLGFCGLLFTENAWNERLNNLNLNDEPEVEQLRFLLESCEDGDGPHVLSVWWDGDVEIRPLAEMVQDVKDYKRDYAGDGSLFDGYIIFRYKSWPAGRGYVGKEAARNSTWVSRLFARLLQDHRRGAEHRVVWEDSPSLCISAK